MFIEAHHFAHSAMETWTGGKFVSYKAVTDDNGNISMLTAVAKDDEVLLDVNGDPQQTAAATWSSRASGARISSIRPCLLHPDSGVQLQVKVKDLGEEQIDLHGDQIKAEHYEISRRS